MAEIHIDDFYQDTSIALLQLYSVFPRKHTIYVEDIIGPSQTDEFGLHSKRHESCFAALLWLADEGLLRYEALIKREAIDQAVLSQKAFIALTSIHDAPLFPALETDPNSIVKQKHTVINQLKIAVKNSDSHDIETLMRYFFRHYNTGTACRV